jgi:hypothetical protein
MQYVAFSAFPQREGKPTKKPRNPKDLMVMVLINILVSGWGPGFALPRIRVTGRRGGGVAGVGRWNRGKQSGPVSKSIRKERGGWKFFGEVRVRVQ